MENKLIEVFDRHCGGYPMHFELYYSKMMDWYCKIYKKGCGENGEDLVITLVQHCDKDYVMAKAYVDLCNHLSEHRGGY